eukprot:183142_1
MGCAFVTSNENKKQTTNSHLLHSGCENNTEIKYSDCSNHLNCDKVLRLKEIIIYYNEWCSNEKKEDNGIFEYIDNIYSNVHDVSIENNRYIRACIVLLLEDYQHLINEHEFEFEDIFNLYVNNNNNKCDIDCCPMTIRNHRDRGNKNLNHQQSRSQLYYKHTDIYQVITQQILDQMHCYIYHQFDMGFRLTKKEKQSIINNINDDDDDDDEHIDDDEDKKMNDFKSRIG